METKLSNIDKILHHGKYLIIHKVVIYLLGCPLPSNSGKWRFIGIPY